MDIHDAETQLSRILEDVSGQAFVYRVVQDGIEESLELDVAGSGSTGLGRRLHMGDGRAIVKGPWATDRVQRVSRRSDTY